MLKLCPRVSLDLWLKLSLLGDYGVFGSVSVLVQPLSQLPFDGCYAYFLAVCLVSVACSGLTQDPKMSEVKL